MSIKFILAATKNISISWGNINFSFSNPVFWIGVAIIVLIFLRLWGIKKFISFCVLVTILLFLMSKADDFIINILGKEEGNSYALLTKPFFISIIAFVFIYYTFMQKE